MDYIICALCQCQQSQFVAVLDSSIMASLSISQLEIVALGGQSCYITLPSFVIAIPLTLLSGGPHCLLYKLMSNRLRHVYTQDINTPPHYKRQAVDGGEGRNPTDRSRVFLACHVSDFSELFISSRYGRGTFRELSAQP